MTKQESKLVIFQSQKIRRAWHGDEWHYSVVDVCGALTQSPDAGAYWRKLKQRLNQEGSEVVTICHGLKLVAPDGKKQVTDCANAEGIFGIIQSSPSPKVEPFKRWLTKVGSERIQENKSPRRKQRGIRPVAMKTIYEQKGYPSDWIDKRLRGMAIRQNLTDEWKERGIQEHRDFAILTAEISKATFGVTPSEYKKLKQLPEQSKANLRDHMDDLDIKNTGELDG